MQENTGSIGDQLIHYGIEIGFLISGFFGALMMVSKNASQRIGTTVASLLAGTACANYLTPVIINFLPEGVQGRGKYAVAFTMGFMGLKGLEIIIDKFMTDSGEKSRKSGRGSNRATRSGGRKASKRKSGGKPRASGKSKTRKGSGK